MVSVGLTNTSVSISARKSLEKVIVCTFLPKVKGHNNSTCCKVGGGTFLHGNDELIVGLGAGYNVHKLTICPLCVHVLWVNMMWCEVVCCVCM